MASLRDQIRKGSTEILILKLLVDEAMYGYQIVQELKARSHGYFDMKEGLLYPTLHRMQKEGLVSSEWQVSDTGRRRKYYKITTDGLNLLQEGSAEWETFMQQMQALLNMANGGPSTTSS